jgi:hypothetical protein
MTLRGPVWVVLVLRADDLIDLALHQAMHGGQSDADR